jgi:hypothetical protein
MFKTYSSALIYISYVVSLNIKGRKVQCRVFSTLRFSNTSVYLMDEH